MKRILWLAIALASIIAAAVTDVTGTAAAAVDIELQQALLPIVDAHPGKVAVAVKNLKSGDTWQYNGDQPMPTASMIKFPIMVEAYRQAGAGQLDLQKMLTLNEEDKVPGSGILTTHFSAGTQLSLRDAIQLMIVYSDNTATNLVIDQLGLPATTKQMEQLGLVHTKLHSKVFRRDTSIDMERSKTFGLGSTTANETLDLYEWLIGGKLANESSTAAMLEHLYGCSDRGMLCRELPATTKVAHKSGSVSASRGDGGIIATPAGELIVVVLTTDNEDQSWATENAAERLIGQIAGIVYRRYNDDVAADPDAPPAPLGVGSGGYLVEALQRTLNARLQPSPDLGVDGDFGPATERAVKQFQRQQKLPETGRVDEALWQALSPLITEDAPVPAPSVVNAEALTKQPADSLDGMPFVTCKAWAIGDRETGELLWSDHGDLPRDPASVTKIMTAYVVLQMAAEDATILDETVTFSARADATEGSTSGLRTGEKVSMRELLYGLLLPSGNDASVALGEHLGVRLVHVGGGSSPQDAGGPADPLDAFIARMNAVAKELGMRNTRYRNTHGLTDEDHQTTAADMLKLTAAAMKDPLFAEVVQTRQRGATVTGESGYQRNVLWKNTNRLLGTEGYQGVKTGTTNAAGACLVSCGQKDGRHLIVVVLGAANSDARYADSRNLYRWAWQQLAKEGNH
ncbi:MAG: serine hydrolase [Pirellulaceae bacterium]|nr:serine hydrolase [Planctomycetales bacterium]